jgi:hypothetical protein
MWYDPTVPGEAVCKLRGSMSGFPRNCICIAGTSLTVNAISVADTSLTALKLVVIPRHIRRVADILFLVQNYWNLLLLNSSLL